MKYTGLSAIAGRLFYAVRVTATLFLGMVVMLTGCNRQGHLVEQRLLEFGTIIEITMITSDLEQAEQLLEEIEYRLSLYRDQWHAWEESDLTRFNASLAEGGSAAVPASLARLLELSREYYDASFGLFNPALGKLVAAHGFHGAAANADLVSEIKRDIPSMHDLLVVGQQASTDHPQLQIDLGGIAKGYAIGLISKYLDANGIKHYVVNAGGDLQTAGNRFGRPWRIGIQNPFAPGAIASLELDGHFSLFTSGNYQRRYYRGDKLLHHIIDPVSGESSTQLSSVTILGTDPVRADVAATAMMIDGIRKHRELAESLQIDDYLIVSQSREIILSRSFADKLELTSSWPVKIID